MSGGAASGADHADVSAAGVRWAVAADPAARRAPRRGHYRAHGRGPPQGHPGVAAACVVHEPADTYTAVLQESQAALTECMTGVVPRLRAVGDHSGEISGPQRPRNRDLREDPAASNCVWPVQRVGRRGLEPRTHGLKVRCSTIELTPLGARPEDADAGSVPTLRACAERRSHPGWQICCHDAHGKLRSRRTSGHLGRRGRPRLRTRFAKIWRRWRCSGGSVAPARRDFTQRRTSAGGGRPSAPAAGESDRPAASGSPLV
jgi:hypothetical protein